MKSKTRTIIGALLFTAALLLAIKSRADTPTPTPTPDPTTVLKAENAKLTEQIQILRSAVQLFRQQRDQAQSTLADTQAQLQITTADLEAAKKASQPPPAPTPPPAK